jgi:hypothetical protein
MRFIELKLGRSAGGGSSSNCAVQWARNLAIKKAPRGEDRAGPKVRALWEDCPLTYP